jgi:hypothetical protein
MRVTRWHLQRGVLVVAGVAAALSTAPGIPVASAATVPGPVLRLEAAQRSITLERVGGKVLLDPGIWVAALGSPLQFDVRRMPYTSPITITQIIHAPFGGIVRRPLPTSILDGWNGLRRFIRLTARNAAGQVVVSHQVTFCPDSYQPARVRPASPPTSPYPQQCPTVPFARGMVWGVQKGWAIDPIQTDFFGPGPVKLPLGVYRLTETISSVYRRLFGISARDATATVTVKVVKGRARSATAYPARTPGSLPSAPAVPYLKQPPPAALPDLVALPAWQIRSSHSSKGDFLDFAATVWIGGNGPLDVEGFRSHASPVMKAYQYFWRGGHVIGRARAGTMGFDNRRGHNHWHFEQFARYALVNAAKSLVVRSHKQGFCIAPSDEVDLLLPHAVWQPPFVGLQGECGSPTALWVAEELPVGWGDTYIQSIAGQSFNITHVPNGTYYIEVIANPERVLSETTTGNDISLRKLILGGTSGHRTVKVPPWHGIDPEP